MFKLNRVKISLVLLSTLLLQSCYTYKTMPLEKMRSGKLYRVQINDGREITTKFLEASLDSLVFKARDRKLSVSKKAIKSVERKRNSPVNYIVVIAIPALLIFEVLRNDDPPILM